MVEDDLCHNIAFGSAVRLVRGAASPTGLLMSLNLSRNAVAMERALGFLADAERALDDCSSCLARDVIVSEAQATEHNRSIVCAKDALLALRRQIRGEHEEVCRHLQEAQLRFLQSKPLISLATGYTGCDTTFERALDLSAFVYAPDVDDPWGTDEAEGYGATQRRILPAASTSSISQQMVVQTGAGSVEDTGGSDRQVNSSLDAVDHDDDVETVRAYSDDGHSYAGTIVRGVLRDDSE